MKSKAQYFFITLVFVFIIIITYVFYRLSGDSQTISKTIQAEYSVQSYAGNATVFDSRGHEILSLANLAERPGQTSIVILNDNAYWLAKVREGKYFIEPHKTPGPYRGSVTDRWTELRVTDLRTKETKVLFADQEIEFKFNHRKTAIAVSHSSYDNQNSKGRAAVLIIELPDRVQQDFVQYVEEYTFGEYSIVGWSADDSALYATLGVIGNWDELVVYKDRQVMHIPEVHGGDDTIIDCDFGWVVYSDYPEIYDSDSREEYERSGKTNTLWLYGIFQKKRVKVATSTASRFYPGWQTLSQKTRKLVYYVEDKESTADPLVLLDSAVTATTTKSN